MSLNSDAWRHARLAHADQVYGGKTVGLPYVVHLGHVVAVLLRFEHTDDSMLAAAWLHDIVEDTSWTLDEVRDEFFSGVANIVELLTDPPGKNRRERHAALHRRYAVVAHSDQHLCDHALTVKLADRIANVEASMLGNPGLLAMYRKEHDGFRNALEHLGGDAGMWLYLNKLLG